MRFERLADLDQVRRNSRSILQCHLRGENRELARAIAQQLESLDCSVFFDEFFEANYLGKVWHKNFMEIFGQQSRFVVCLLDKFHVEKIWPTFERECFTPRVTEAAVIPVFLDDTVVLGIPKDIVGISFKSYESFGDSLPNRITNDIVFKLLARLEDVFANHSLIRTHCSTLHKAGHFILGI